MDLRSAFNSEAVFSTLADLISINSVNPHYPGGLGEAALAEYVAHFFKKHGIPYEIQPVWTDRSNVVAKLEGKPGGSTIILEAHMDTATELGMRIPPFRPTRADGRMYGRGSCDDKGGLAAMMHAVKALAEVNPRPSHSVTLVAAVDEEYSFGGAIKFAENRLRADGVIAAEPTDLEIAVASKGVLRWRFKTHGRTSHSSKPELGVNAITKMARLITELEERLPPVYQGRHHSLLGSPTLNFGIIQGGNQVNQVPDLCVVDVDRRWLPSETREQILGEFEAMLADLRGLDSEFDIEVEPPYLVGDPLETSPGTKIVKTAEQVLQEVCCRSSLVGVTYASDATKLCCLGPTIIFGPGNIDQAHTEEEYVDLEQVTIAALVYAQIVMNFH